MDTHEGFLRDIIEHPDDDAPRLIYADWLDDQGEPERAEFIRVQCRLARLPAADPEAAELERRAEGLAGGGPAWLGPLHGVVEEYEYRRGFIEQVSMPALRFLQHQGALFRLAPVRDLCLTRAGTRLEEVAGSPHLARLSALRVRYSRPNPAGVQALTHSPRLAGLQ